MRHKQYFSQFRHGYQNYRGYFRGRKESEKIILRKRIENKEIPPSDKKGGFSFETGMCFNIHPCNGILLYFFPFLPRFLVEFADPQEQGQEEQAEHKGWLRIKLAIYPVTNQEE
jgi:hypothetical protein